ncbi:DUF1801 domain-containing protein [Luteimonas aestuarii]|uniref:DUF1801 domain-containing protein n=1 Tax=Luteimonas aestuarii TaxID=453837 RepID=A0A4R5U0P0_9GAMM|nr:DUF1801 domain-containing protein [Luteimonas aestuarii]TDK27119.1 DUF1801 domain-containing protein [Luteimonas aestuarii]
MASKAPKTRPETRDAGAFIDGIDNPQRREDARTLLAMMRAATGCEPVMWGASIVGFDRYRYRYESGREGDWPIVGFSPRKQALVLYVMPGFDGYDDLLARLGRFTHGKSCLYVKRLSDVDPVVLDALVRASVADMRRRYPPASG